MAARLSTRPTVIDLFAGAGLFSLGFAQEGFDVVRALELDPVACATYAANLGNHVECADVSRTEPSGRCDVLIAGPPCQGFSTLGTRRVDDPRNGLGLDVVRWAEAMHPQVVIIENVAAFLTALIWQQLARRLERLGYKVTAGEYNALDFGVPQIRRRSFTIAARGPVPLIRPLRHGGAARTVREAWEGLSPDPDGRNHHYAPQPSPLAQARMEVIPPGGDKRDVMRTVPHVVPKSWWSLNCEATDVWGRMHWDRPSNTLRTALQNPSKGRYIHPEQHRVISLREAARLHSIPDGWTFVGKPYPIARQIGNSVPPRLARSIARAVRSML